MTGKGVDIMPAKVHFGAEIAKVRADFVHLLAQSGAKMARIFPTKGNNAGDLGMNFGKTSYYKYK